MTSRVFAPIAYIVVITTLVSAAYSFYYHDRPRVDAHAYDRIGWNLARGLGYVEIESNAAHPRADDAIVRVGPGYQFFLAGLYWIFGHTIWIVWIAHALLRGISVYIVYRTALLVFSGYFSSARNNRVALLAAMLFGFSPDLIMINGLLLTETFFIFLLVTAAYLSLRLIAARRNVSLLAWGASATWAGAILTRPVALLPFVVFLGIVIWRKQVRAAFIIFALPALLIGMWSYRMTMRYDYFILTTTAGWYDVWVGNNPQATGGFEKSPIIQEFRDKTYDSTILDRIGRQKYFEFLTQQPLQFLELQWRKTALYFSLFRPGGYWIHLFDRTWDLRVSLGSSLIWTFLLFAGGLGGAYLLLQNHRDAVSRLIVAFAVLQPLAVIPIIVETRYRYSLFPFLAIFAAYFFLAARPRLYLVGASVSVFLIMCSGYDLWYNFADIMSKIGFVL